MIQDLLTYWKKISSRLLERRPVVPQQRWRVGILARRTSQYIEQNEPWRLTRQAGQESRLDSVLYSAAEARRLLALFLAPYIPSASNRILAQLGLGTVSNAAWVNEGTWGSCPLTRVVPGPLLFPRIVAG